jgi:UDPglucose--hexose-1-phosphate uridylyltransferase
MSQLRLNPLTGRWVTIVTERSERPSDFAPRAAQVEADPGRPCPFCPGYEHEVVPTLESVGTDGHWRMRVLPNLYPAFDGDEPFSVHHLGPVHVVAEASGTHEVFVFTRDHYGGLHGLDDAQAAESMRLLAQRLAEHATHPNLRYTQAIINHGREAGASLTHPHGQLLGLSFVPGEILEEQRAFHRFEGGCILCTTIESELVDGKRVLAADDHVLVICPFWSGSPYQLMVVPRHHDQHLTDSDPDTLSAVGVALRDGLRALRNLHGDIAYNVVLHTAPHHYNGAYHWHIHVLPKLITTAGFEAGTGVMINIVPPESAAATLRDIFVPA